MFSLWGSVSVFLLFHFISYGKLAIYPNFVLSEYFLHYNNGDHLIISSDNTILMFFSLNSPALAGFLINIIEHGCPFCLFFWKSLKNFVVRCNKTVSGTNILIVYTLTSLCVIVGLVKIQIEGSCISLEAQQFYDICNLITYVVLNLTIILLYANFLYSDSQTDEKVSFGVFLWFWFIHGLFLSLWFFWIYHTGILWWFMFILCLLFTIYFLWCCYLYIYYSNVFCYPGFFYSKYTYYLILQNVTRNPWFIEFKNKTQFARSLILWVTFVMLAIIGSIFWATYDHFILSSYLVYMGLIVWLSDVFFITRISSLKLILVPVIIILRMLLSFGLRSPFSFPVLQNNPWAKIAALMKTFTGPLSERLDAIVKKIPNSVTQMEQSPQDTQKFTSLLKRIKQTVDNFPILHPSAEDIDFLRKERLFDVDRACTTPYGFNLAAAIALKNGQLFQRKHYQILQPYLENAQTGYFSSKLPDNARLTLFSWISLVEDLAIYEQQLFNKRVELVQKYPFIAALEANNIPEFYRLLKLALVEDIELDPKDDKIQFGNLKNYATGKRGPTEQDILKTFKSLERGTASGTILVTSTKTTTAQHFRFTVDALNHQGLELRPIYGFTTHESAEFVVHEQGWDPIRHGGYQNYTIYRSVALLETVKRVIYGRIILEKNGVISGELWTFEKSSQIALQYLYNGPRPVTPWRENLQRYLREDPINVIARPTIKPLPKFRDHTGRIIVKPDDDDV